MAVPKTIEKYLQKQSVKFEAVPHRKVFTAYDLAQTLRHDLKEIAKTLLIKGDKEFRLVVLRASDRLDLKKLAKALDVKSLSIAREQDMVKSMKVKPGAITPFGGAHKLPVVMEKGLLKAKRALFGSGSFTDSIKLSVKDFVRSEQPLLASFGQSAGLKLQSPAKAKKRPAKGKGKKKGS